MYASHCISGIGCEKKPTTREFQAKQKSIFLSNTSTFSLLQFDEIEVTRYQTILKDAPIWDIDPLTLIRDDNYGTP